MKPFGFWDSDEAYEFIVVGKSDSDFEKCSVTRRSASGFVTYLMGALITAKSVRQKVVALPVAEAELMARV